MEEIIMKTLNWLLGGLTAIAFTACTQDEWIDNAAAPGEKVSVKAYAPGDGNNARVAFTPNNEANTIALAWETEERFSVIRGSENQTFVKDTEGNTFEGILPVTGNGNYYAVYPANTNATDATRVPFDLSVQTGTLDSNITYMYATPSNGTSFSFHHSTAILKATFTGMETGEDIQQLVVTTVDGKVNGTINLTDGTMTGAGCNRITINFTSHLDPVNSPVYIYLPPMAAENKTLTFEVTSTQGNVYKASLEGNSSNVIEAGYLYTAENITLTEAEIPYITFKSANLNTTQGITLYDSDFGITDVGSDGKTRLFQYSLNGGEWTNITQYNSIIRFEGENSTIRLRGKSIDGTSTSLQEHIRIEISNNYNMVSCTGDIRTLVDYENYTTVSTANARFGHLFSGCDMLTSAPELPATDLADYCYYAMFSQCEQLTVAPALPATTLANYCYTSMFQNCSRLVSAPALPAPVLTQECYAWMFKSCEKLTTAPALPSVSLANMCYYGMFNGCTLLTTAPKLPAPTLVNSCYYNMFKNCSSLNNVTMLATDINAQGCLNAWLSGVASEGTFTRAESMTSLPEGENGIPTNWIVQTK